MQPDTIEDSLTVRPSAEIAWKRKWLQYSPMNSPLYPLKSADRIIDFARFSRRDDFGKRSKFLLLIERTISSTGRVCGGTKLVS
jgi:hypothetical protein